MKEIYSDESFHAQCFFEHLILDSNCCVQVFWLDKHQSVELWLKMSVSSECEMSVEGFQQRRPLPPCLRDEARSIAIASPHQHIGGGWPPYLLEFTSEHLRVRKA